MVRVMGALWSISAFSCASCLIQIWHEAHENAEMLHNAPITRTIGRPDDTKAAREPVLRYQF